MDTNKHKRYNLMIVDLNERIGLFLKSILLGSDCRVSISSSPSSVRAKLETGLFDGALVDLSNREERREVESMIDEHTPGRETFPVGTITDDEQIRLSPSERTITRPVRIHRFQQLVRHMKKRMSDRRYSEAQQIGSSVSCRLRMQEADQTLPVSSVVLNTRGLLATLQERRDAGLQQQLTDDDVQLILTLPDENRDLTLPGRATFTEHGSNDDVTAVGLKFDEETDRVQQTLTRLEDRGALQTNDKN